MLYIIYISENCRCALLYLIMTNSDLRSFHLSPLDYLGNLSSWKTLGLIYYETPSTHTFCLLCVTTSLDQAFLFLV